jgi:hypothetical protein
MATTTTMALVVKTVKDMLDMANRRALAPACAYPFSIDLAHGVDWGCWRV